VPIIDRNQLQKSTSESEAGLETRLLVGKDRGSRSLHIEEVTVAPAARVPRCVNPHTEVAIVVLEGTLDATLGRQRATLGPGDAMLAPAGAAHGFLNRYSYPARVLFIFPTHDAERVPVSVPGATSGFLSEKGLAGYESPEDRPLGDGRS
jgi:quercetin dioxygenase-like cupin family protein